MNKSNIEAVYNQKSRSALDRIQVDPTNKQSYYVAPNNTLSEMQKSTVVRRKRKQTKTLPCGTLQKRYVNFVSKGSIVKVRNDDQAIMDQQNKNDDPKPSPRKIGKQRLTQRITQLNPMSKLVSQIQRLSGLHKGPNLVRFDLSSILVTCNYFSAVCLCS